MTRFKKLPSTELIVDERYQRPLDMVRVERIVKKFEAERFGVLEVADRGGIYAVFDGQHRLIAARKLGMERVPCLIHTGVSEVREAGLFVSLQQGRKGINPVEKFRARCFAGDEDAQTIASVIDAAGFRVEQRGDGGPVYAIRAITAVEWVFRKYGDAHLLYTLETVRELWGGDQRSTDGYLLQGLAQFLDGYGNRFGDEQAARLRVESPTVILRRALGPLQGGGAHARHAVDQTLRKLSGVRGRPSSTRVSAEPADA